MILLDSWGRLAEKAESRLTMPMFLGPVSWRFIFENFSLRKIPRPNLKLDGVAPLIADPPPLKLHQ